MNDGDHDPLWGTPPPDEQLANAHAIGRRAQREARRDALAGALTPAEAAERLGTSAAEIRRRVECRQLVAFDHDRGELRLPAWQCTARGPLPGLADLIAVWPGTTLALTIFALRPHPDLNGRTPAQELARAGAPARVLELVAAITPDAW